MAGVPVSRGCESCRKKKKKCDEKKPICGRCKRLMIACIGNGVRRFQFKSEAFQTIQGRAQPSSQSRVQSDIERPPINAQARLVNKLVWALDAKEVKYDMTIHGAYILNLPRHVGASPVIDASVELLVASIGAARGTSCKNEALSLHIDAISTLRKSLMAGGNAIDNMTAIWIIDTCNKFIEFQLDSRVSHGEVLAHLLHETNLNSIDATLLQHLIRMMVFESFGNPKIHLPASFWQLVNRGGLPRPMVKGNGYSFLSLELQTAADIAFHLRDTERYVYQIRCTYEMVLADYPVLLAIVGRVTRDAGESATLQAHRISMRFQLAFGLLLAMGCTLNRILRIYDGEVAQLVTTYHLFCDDTIVLAENLEKYRPSTSAFMPVVLMCAWAASTDGYRVEEIEKWLINYQGDHVTDNYTELGRNVREAYEGIRERYLAKESVAEEGRRNRGFSPWKESFNPRDEGCTIL